MLATLGTANFLTQSPRDLLGPLGSEALGAALGIATSTQGTGPHASLSQFSKARLQPCNMVLNPETAGDQEP